MEFHASREELLKAAGITPNVEIVRAGYEALARGELGAVLAMAAADVEGEMIVERFRGREEFARYLDALPWDSMGVEPLDFRGAGDHVLVTLRLSGRGEGSSAPINAVFAHLWTVREGKGIRLRSFRDPDEAASAMPLG